MGRPGAIVQAEIIEAMAQRYGKLPRQILKEDASLFQHVALAYMAPRDEE